jgi:Fe-S cluster assembly protein SufD
VSTEIVAAPPGALSREAVEELWRSRQEPQWLLNIRLRGFEAFERMPLPDQRTEGWRRTSLRGLNVAAFDPRSVAADTRSATPDDSLAKLAGARLIAYQNGTLVRGDALRAGRVVDLREALREPWLAERIRRHFATIVAPDADKFTAFHYAFFNVGTVVLVPSGTAIDEPIWVSYESDAADHAALVHTLLLAEDESAVSVVEDLSGVAGLCSGVVEQVIGANAHVRYVQLQQFGSDVWNFSTQRARLARDASLRTLTVTNGGRVSRNTVQVVLDGRGSQADLLGVADIAGRQHVDFQTLQEHSGDATRSDLVIHNALRDRSSANFTGLIRINKTAHQTESSQEQKNVLLSDTARADSDPRLEILNNDVIRCTHGAAVGPVDEEMVFYLESRGLERLAAERLIVEGFFQSTLGRLGLPPVEQAVWSAITRRWTDQ